MKELNDCSESEMKIITDVVKSLKETLKKNNKHYGKREHWEEKEEK